MFFEYIYIIIAFIIAMLLAFCLYIFSYNLIQTNISLEKISVYECGFDPFERVRGVFDVKFYLVAILFIIFDIEIIFLFPWVLVLVHIGFFGIFIMIIFLLLLGLVYVYEWLLGALDW
jgi:NADH-quinone oxidoreductase subunit A